MARPAASSRGSSPISGVVSGVVSGVGFFPPGVISAVPMGLGDLDSAASFSLLALWTSAQSSKFCSCLRSLASRAFRASFFLKVLPDGMYQLPLSVLTSRPSGGRDDTSSHFPVSAFHIDGRPWVGLGVVSQLALFASFSNRLVLYGFTASSLAGLLPPGGVSEFSMASLCFFSSSILASRRARRNTSSSRSSF